MMKHAIGLFCFLLCTFGTMLGQNRLVFDSQLYRFYEPSGNPYVELNLFLLNSSLLNPQLGDINSEKGAVATFYFEKNGSISQANRLQYYMGNAKDKDQFDVQRLRLEPGNYLFHVEVQDALDSTRKAMHEEVIAIQAASGSTISDLQLLSDLKQNNKGDARFEKYGFTYEPIKFSYLNGAASVLHVFCETLLTAQDSAQGALVELRLYRTNHEKQELISKRFKRLKAARHQPIIFSQPLDSNFVNGSYLVRCLLRNKALEVLDSNQAEVVINSVYCQDEMMLDKEEVGQRFVDSLDDDALRFALKAITVKINPLDIERLNFLIAQGTIEEKRRFLYDFWYIVSPLEPYYGFVKYMEVVRAVDKEYFDGFGHGFESDRGYIFLKYGRPSRIITEEHDSTAPPYEIWAYDDFPVTNQAHVKFLFYNPSLAHNRYELLHSTARGERNNPRWLIDLYKNSPQDIIGNPQDATQVKDYYNRRAAEFFNEN